MGDGTGGEFPQWIFGCSCITAAFYHTGAAFLPEATLSMASQLVGF